ncbi:MAG: stage III sporulation protein AA [Lachnospiraceae bacterium]|nr:stage III sporulation protein AA [Lachnospiraceae bacterium]
MTKKDEILKLLSGKIRMLFLDMHLRYECLQEIRLRVNTPLILVLAGKEYFVSEYGQLINDINNTYIVTTQDMKETLEYISNFSLYAYEDEIRQGFITVHGGHRIGVAGRVILDGERIKSIQHISFMNIRISHEIKGCANRIIPYLYNGNEICHTLIISPPCCGKTTMLRDVVRLLSDGDNNRAGVCVGLVDERSEIAACYKGIPQNDVGIRTDILDCCPKAEGMLMLIRSMSPRLIAVDEIGKKEDIDAIAYVMNCGCKMLATVHGSSMEDIRKKPVLKRLIEDKMFARYIILQSGHRPGVIDSICNENGQALYIGRQAREYSF